MPEQKNKPSEEIFKDDRFGLIDLDEPKPFEKPLNEVHLERMIDLDDGPPSQDVILKVAVSDSAEVKPISAPKKDGIQTFLRKSIHKEGQQEAQVVTDTANEISRLIPAMNQYQRLGLDDDQLARMKQRIKDIPVGETKPVGNSYLLRPEIWQILVTRDSETSFTVKVVW